MRPHRHPTSAVVSAVAAEVVVTAVGVVVADVVVLVAVVIAGIPQYTCLSFPSDVISLLDPRRQSERVL